MSYLRSPVRARALDAISTADGVVCGVAVDHRDSLRVILERKGIAGVDDELVGAFKLRIVRALAPAASLLLLDPDHAPRAIADGALPGATSLAVPLEAAGYGDVASLRVTGLLEDWSPVRARRLGADAAKLLLPYRVDDEEQAAAQDAVVRRCVAACREAGVAFILEPVVYARPGEERPGGDHYADLVVAGARRLAALEPDVLKLQYPGSPAACAALDEAVGRAIPWVLLGGGADPDALLGQVEDACRAGASGYIVGRTLFDAGLVADAGESELRLAAESRPLADRLAALAGALALPWRRRLGELPLPAFGWYRT